MIEFILNDIDIATGRPTGMTVLDFVRYQKNLKGTKIGCREGDCGACTILVGELKDGNVRYRSMTSCLMPLANAAGKHIVTIEGINPADGSLTPVQEAMVEENGTQCGFCTVGFVMSLTGFCIDDTSKTPEMAISSVDGNICRCTGYKSIERAAKRLCGEPDSATHNGGADAALGGRGGSLREAIHNLIVPEYFDGIAERLASLTSEINGKQLTGRPLTQAVPTFVGGGTDVYVQRPETIAESEASHVFYHEDLRGIRDLGDAIEIGASATVTDLLESPVMNKAFPNLYKYLKLVSSTPIRNMATLAGNFVNASPIGDMTVWFLALNAEIDLCRSPRLSKGEIRTLPLKSLYLGYKQLKKDQDEFITAIRFRRPTPDHYFNFEKVCKRTYLDIATVNTAIHLKCEALPGPTWTPPALSEPEAVATGLLSEPPASAGGQFATTDTSNIEFSILDAHVSAGGVAPIPLYLKETSSFLVGRTVNKETIEKANEIMQLEISPISDVRGTESYKRLLLRQLLLAHFVELFDC